MYVVLHTVICFWSLPRLRSADRRSSRASRFAGTVSLSPLPVSGDAESAQETHRGQVVDDEDVDEDVLVLPVCVLLGGVVIGGAVLDDVDVVDADVDFVVCDVADFVGLLASSELMVFSVAVVAAV